MSSLKNPVEFDGDIVKLFDELTSGRQKGLTRTSPNGAKFGTVEGRINKRNLTVFSVARAGATERSQLAGDIQTILHELIHGAARNKSFSDRQIAEALFADPRYSNIPNNATELMKNPSKSMLADAGDYGWGQYWDSLLDYHCFKQEEMVNGKPVMVNSVLNDILK